MRHQRKQRGLTVPVLLNINVKQDISYMSFRAYEQSNK